MKMHFRVWERKSRRHKWQLCLETDSKCRADDCFAVRTFIHNRWDKWPVAEIGLDSIEREPGGRVMEDNDFALPQNAPMLRVWARC